MPTYTYLCSACEHRFTEVQAMSAERLTKCPACHKNKLERLISGGGGVVFKGSGFYETDYKRKNSGSEDSSNAPKPETPTTKPSENTSSSTD